MRGITKKTLSLVIAGACILTASTHMPYNQAPMTAAAKDYDEQGTVDGYCYEVWAQNEFGDFKYENMENNGFRFTWEDNIVNVVSLKGKTFDVPVNAADFSDYYVSYDADVYFNNNTVLSVYGTMKDCKVQFKVIDAWGSWRPPGYNNCVAKTEIDGCTYEIYDIIRDQEGCFGDTPEKAYHDVISLRTSQLACARKGTHINNTINMKEHFKAWEEAGITLGCVDEVMLSVDGYRSGGDVCVNYLDMGDEPNSIEPSQVKQHIQYLNEKLELSSENYVIDSGDINASIINGEKDFVPRSAVATSCDELKEYLAYCLNEKAAEAFAANYDDSFFEGNVLLLNTFLDPYKGRINHHFLNKAYYSEDKLNILFTSVIDPHLMESYGMDILSIVLPKEEYKDGAEAVWEKREELYDNTKRISIIDEDTGELIEMPDTEYSKLLTEVDPATDMEIEGNNPYYVYTDTTHRYFNLWLDDTYLPGGYITTSRRDIDGANESGEYIFYVKNIVNGDVNDDGNFSVADIVAVQKWMLNPQTQKLWNWKAADFFKDNKLDVFDLCLMRKKILEQSTVLS